VHFVLPVNCGRGGMGGRAVLKFQCRKVQEFGPARTR